jgi:membrane protein
VSPDDQPRPDQLARRPAIRLLRALRGVRTAVVLTGRAAWLGGVRFYNGDDLTYAASIAYYALLSLFPFFLLAFSIIGSVTTNEADRVVVVDFFLRYFPMHLAFVTHQLDALRQAHLQIGIGGVIGLVWAALGVFSAISSAVNHAWGVQQQRSYLKHNLVSFLMLVAAGALLLSALVLLSASQIVEASWFTAVAERFPATLALTGLAWRWATTLMLIVVVGLVFYFLPNAKVRFRDVWIGAIVTGLLWRGALEGFSWYVRDMSRYTAVHGSIAAVVVFLVWVYISAVILLYGVELTAAYARLRRGRPDELPAAPSPRT